MSARNWLAVAAMVAALLAPLGGRAQNITCVGTRAAGVSVKVVTVYLDDLNVKVTGQMTRWGAGHAEPFERMARRGHPTVAITGTFFSLGSLRPTGDIVIDGRLACSGDYGTALCITDNNEVEFIRPARYTPVDWGRFDFVMRCGQRLLNDGRFVDPRSEDFHSRYLLAPHPRMAIGLTRDNRLLIVATRQKVHLSRLARALKALGAVDAVNLDGGSSIGLYYKGRTIMRPARRLTNLVLVYDDRWRYELHKEALLPERLRAAQR